MQAHQNRGKNARYGVILRDFGFGIGFRGLTSGSSNIGESESGVTFIY